MALQWKRNTRYPSVTRPGAFPRIQEFNDLGEDILEDTWFELTGIDEEEINKFKFALGTWTQVSRRNRKIRILSVSDANTITYPITADEESATTEPKPDYVPDNYVSDIFTWALFRDGAQNKVIIDSSLNQIQKCVFSLGFSNLEAEIKKPLNK